MKPKILVVAAIPRKGLSELEKKCDLIYPTQNFMFSDEEIKEHIREVDGVLSVFIKPFKAEMMNEGKQVKIIANFGVGFNNIDVTKATEMGIVVCNTPNAVTEPTAEMAFGLLLALTRNIALTDRGLRSNPHFKWGMMENLGKGTFGKTVGIVGMGRIGQAFARRAIASGMKVIYYNRTRLAGDIEQKYDCRLVSMKELLEKSDVISLHCPLNNETHHLLGEAAMQSMKQGAIIINTARGPVIDEKMLVKYLQNGKLGGAGLDVFEAEPVITPELLALDNVVLTPHNATGTIDTRIEIAHEAAANILGFFEGRRDISIVNPGVWS
ncbi:MAG: NAD(P)-binding domain-containing protein [Prolixibacteraceae bacterium]|nr:NAD(P)-binding domain-containing protein [Prolixibacteraceae bacterium]